MEFLKRVITYLLTLEARAVLWRYRPKIIAVTGSVGKTTTKDAICAALSRDRRVRKSEKSFNSDIGVPLSILGLENAWRNPLLWAVNLVRGLMLLMRKSPYPEWLILEIGADRPGDIYRIARYLKPDIVVITGVPEIPVHVEYFRSPEELAREKISLAEHMREGGTLILNGDDERMAKLCKELLPITYGFGKQNRFVATYYAISYEKGKPVGTRFRLAKSAMVTPVSIYGALGRARTYAALAAFSVGDLVGVHPAEVARALSEWVPPPGRMRVLRGVHGSTIIDDTYNSSPAAALSALDTLKEVKAIRRIAVLGDMLELGRFTSDAHRQAGKRAAQTAEKLVTVGFRSRATGEAALDAGMPDANIREYEQGESRRVGAELRDELRGGDVVLVKGSQSMRMERAVEELMGEPEKASELLVRQEPEWLLRK